MFTRCEVGGGRLLPLDMTSVITFPSGIISFISSRTSLRVLSLKELEVRSVFESLNYVVEVGLGPVCICVFARGGF